jgi:hypothetical protein
MSNELTTTHNAEPVAFDGAGAFRASTNAAGLCAAIVQATAKPIQGRKYVAVEGWQSIAIAHGCTASARDVEKVEGGWKAIGEVRRMSDGRLIAQAEGFLGEDEKMWASRPLFARRAMVQTRAISRACRSAFAHVVIMIDADLGTTPAEEMEAAVGSEKVASVTGEVQKRKPAWSDEQKAAAGTLRREIEEYGGQSGADAFAALWKRMVYDQPAEVLSALEKLHAATLAKANNAAG